MMLPHSKLIRTHRKTPPRHPEGSAPIKRGFRLSLTGEEVGLKAWDIRGLVAGARILAVHGACSRPPVFTDESAMILHGLTPWAPNPDVFLRVGWRYSTTALPEVAISSCTVPGVRIRQITSALFEDEPLEIDGVLADPLEAISLHMACTRAFLDALTCVCESLRALSAFDRFRIEESRVREHQVKRRMLEKLRRMNERRSLRGLHRAELIVRYSHAACESIGEIGLLGVLLTLFPDELVSQYEILTGGRRYFADFALVRWRILIEFDGVGKMGADEASFNRAKRDFLARQRSLEDAGWTVIRVGWADVLDPQGLRAKLIERILRVQAQKGDVELPGETAQAFLEMLIRA